MLTRKMRSSSQFMTLIWSLISLLHCTALYQQLNWGGNESQFVSMQDDMVSLSSRLKLLSAEAQTYVQRHKHVLL